MRTPSTLVAIILTVGLGVSGCLGGGGGEDDAFQPKLTEFLNITIEADQATDGVWFEPGTALGVEAIVSPNAVGNVTYTWAYQPDPFSDFFESDAIDTGTLEPGESGNLTFTEPGFYEFGHCDPHPWMKHTVAVLEGYDGPDEMTVYILEGDVADSDTYRFSQEHITVGVGTKVTYVNIGEVPHTASIAHEGEAIPTPETLSLDGASGTVTLEGSSWMNLLVFAEDEEGNAGWGKLNVYVREKFADYNQTSTGEFTSTEDPDDTHEHKFEWSGNVTVSVSVEDASASVQRIDVRLAEKDSEAPALVDEENVGTDTFTATVKTVIPRDYVLTVSPRQGVLTAYEITVTVEYDHTPPPRGDDLPCPEPHYSLGHC